MQKGFRLLMLGLLLVLPFVVWAQEKTPPAHYKVDPAHTQVLFKVRHMGISWVTGRFEAVDADIWVDPSNLSTFRVEAIIPVASIDTGNEKRDNHLKSADFFDGERYPQITFVSKEVKSVEGSRFTVVGDLTIKGITKPVTLNVEYLGQARDPWGNTRIAFLADGRIDRREFGLTWNKALETGGFLVGNEVRIQLEVQAIQQAEGTR